MSILYEKKYNRWGYLPLILASLFLGAVFFTYGFAFERTIESFDDLHFFSEEISIWQNALGAALTLFCLTFTGYWCYSLLVNPTVFRITTEGFESIPNGVSSGFIPWSEVKEARLEIIKGSNAQGVYEEQILAVYFKNPDYYKNKQGEYVKTIMGVGEQTGFYDQLNTDSTREGVPLLIPASVFGDEITTVTTIFQKSTIKNES
ncbi:MAG: hypothetical protein SFU91_08250 [Chloroherpetonaceae bacterium]|nr:hypothetical protein [Chloroherpetonaceae bacterium]